MCGCVEPTNHSIHFFPSEILGNDSCSIKALETRSSLRCGSVKYPFIKDDYISLNFIGPWESTLLQRQIIRYTFVMLHTLYLFETKCFLHVLVSHIASPQPGDDLSGVLYYPRNE